MRLGTHRHARAEQGNIDRITLVWRQSEAGCVYGAQPDSAPECAITVTPPDWDAQWNGTLNLTAGDWVLKGNFPHTLYNGTNQVEWILLDGVTEHIIIQKNEFVAPGPDVYAGAVLQTITIADGSVIFYTSGSGSGAPLLETATFTLTKVII